MKQVLQIHSILPGQKPDKHFSIPQQNNSVQQAPAQQQPVQPEAAALTQQQEQRPPVQQVTQQQPPVYQYEPQPQAQQQYAQQEPQVDQLQQKLAGVELNQSSSNGYEPISFSPYQAESAHPPPAQSQTTEMNPPSKLLHSNPVPEPTRDDRLQRKDSETLEEDEFHDAHS